jgi:hypothetical protein
MSCARTQSPHRTAAVRTSQHAPVTMASTTVAAGGAHSRTAAWLLEADRPGWWSNRQSLHQAGGPWLPWHTEVYMELSIDCYKSFIFLPITNRDCVAVR